ncbi:hypothetical protein [Desulfonema magnum]|uniref:hypothetical protein n=1 Tax=Desulfonema magnum TaxID=45655 RepID=UPI001A9AE262|nr:hypothetical protein [Desulfonema magnum]
MTRSFEHLNTKRPGYIPTQSVEMRVIILFTSLLSSMPSLVPRHHPELYTHVLNRVCLPLLYCSQPVL